MEWNENLATGYEEIDNQHKELINRLNYVLDLCVREEGRDVVREALDSWGAYTIDHFRGEERLQREHEYPGYPAHRERHDSLVEAIQELHERLDGEEPLSALSMQINSSFAPELTQHFFEDDSRLVRHIKERQALPVS